MSDAPATKPATDPADAALAAPPDDANPALIDARLTFVLTMILSALFIAVVSVFIL